MTRILICFCPHKFQDERYGKGKRVHNQLEKDDNTYRCTVCGREQIVTTEKKR